jgi:hypothetical protein
MDRIFELSLGYVECDVCGSGYNTMYVNHDQWAPADTPFNFVRDSRCYGNLDISGLSRDELVEIVESNRFLVSTRRARQSFNDFLRSLKGGKFDKGASAIQTQSDGDILPAPSPVTVDYPVCNDICCNPGIPEQAYVAPANTTMRTYNFTNQNVSAPEYTVRWADFASGNWSTNPA